VPALSEHLQQFYRLNILYYFMALLGAAFRKISSCLCLLYEWQFSVVANKLVTIDEFDLRGTGPVSTWTGDCVPTGKPYWCVTNCPDYLSLLSLYGR